MSGISHPYVNDQPVTRSNPVPIEVVNNGAPVTPGVATIADNADVAQGATTDAAVITDAPGTISGKLRGLVAWAYTRMPASLGQKVKTASLPVVLASDQDALAVAAGEAHIGQTGGALYEASHEYTRVADTTAYAAKDVIADSTSAPNLMTFANLARVNAGSGYIVKARILTDQKTCTAAFRLHLYHTAPTAINDNSPMALLYANAANRIGYIDFDAMTTEDATSSTAAQSLNATVRLPFVCASASRALYGILETLTAFTPASGQKIVVFLSADEN